jgi:hypothetical protein
MTTEKKIYIGLFVLLVLAGLLYLQSKKSRQDTMTHSAPATSASLPEVKLSSEDADKVSRLVIKNADKPEVVLEKRDDKWLLVKPLEAPANKDNVKQAIDNLKEVKVKDVINDTPEAPNVYKEYQLEAEKAMHVQAFKGQDKAFDAWFGKSGSRGQMARFGDKTAVWVVSGYSSYQFTREIKNWRHTEMLKFEDANVVSAAITNEEGAFSFSKNGDKWSGTFKKKDIERFDPEKVKNMLLAFKNLNAEDFADDKSDEDTGLDKPVATVQIQLKDNAGDYKLSFGKTSTGSSRHVLKDGDKTKYIVGSWTSDWAVSKLDKFQKPDEKDAGASDGGKDKDKKDKPKDDKPKK